MTYYRVSVNRLLKRLVLLACFVAIAIEHESGLLFLWPLEHSCARPANLTIYSNLFVDSKNQTIDLDAVQRNLFDATPEDALTLARAKTMGISYDDVAHCFEYPVDYENGGNESTFNMESLEPCRYGLRFESFAPHLSVVAHFNLACSRQWLKVFVQLAFALGILSGLVVSLSPRLGPKNNILASGGKRNLAQWTITNLLIWMVLYGTTLSSNYLVDTNQPEDYYNLFLACIFLRCLLIATIMCRVLIVWLATSSTDNNTLHSVSSLMGDAIKEQHIYLVAFVTVIIASKASCMPIILRLFKDWTRLSEFLTYEQLWLVISTFGIEFLHSPKQFRLSLLQPHFMSQTGQHDSPPLLEIDELRQDDGDNNNLTKQPQAELLVGELCEFCTVKEERIFGIKHRRGTPSMITLSSLRANQQQRPTAAANANRQDQSHEALAEDRDDSSLAADPITPMVTCDDLLNIHGHQDPYLPTTIPLDCVVLTSESVNKCSRATDDSSTSAVGIVPPPKVVFGGRDQHRQQHVKTNRRLNESESVALKPPRVTSMMRHQVNNKPVQVHHNLSLIELGLIRWPLMGKLFLLTYCLTFNYFLMQTMPDHKLLHAESISSLMERKTNHRLVESERLHESRPLVAKTSETVSSNQTTKHNNDTSQMIMSNLALMGRKIGGSNNNQSRSNGKKGIKVTFKAPADGSFSLSMPATVVATKATTTMKTMTTTTPQHGQRLEKTINSIVLTRSDERNNDTIGQSGRSGPAYETTLSRDEKHNNQQKHLVPSIKNKIMQAERILALASRGHNSANWTLGKGEMASENRNLQHFKYSVEPTPPNRSQNSSIGSPAPLFNYNSVDYATRTFDRLAHSLNPFEICWMTMNLNGWPIELLILLLYTTKLTNFESTYFKLNRLFSLVKYGAKFLLGEWLLIAILPKQNHLIELEWLLASMLIVSRLMTSLMLYSHLHMLFKLSARLSSSRLIEAKITIPIVLLALVAALWAPVLEKINLSLIPLAFTTSSSFVYFLAKSVDSKFKALLCPIMFE